MTRRWIVVGTMLVLLLSAARLAAREINTVIVISPEHLEGTMVSWDAEGLSFRLKDTGKVVDLSWDMLPDPEVKRLQKLAGLTGEGTATAEGYRGSQISAMRIHLKLDRPPIEGVELLDEVDPDAVFIRTNTVQRFRIPRKDIDRIENITLYEMDIYSPEEIYEKRKLARPLRTPEDHYEMAKMCKDLGLYKEAKGHLSLAAELDPRIEERTQPMLEELDALIEEKTAGDLFQEAQRYRASGNYVKALETIDKAEKFLPNHETTRVMTGWKAELEEARQEQLRRDVVKDYYTYHEQCIRKVASGYMSDGAEMPGLVVYLRDGRTISGVMQEETADLLILEKDGTEYQIDKRQISDRRAVDFNRERHRATFDEARSYVTDGEGGVSADVRAALVRKYNISENEVRQIWTERLHRVKVISTRDTVKKRSYAVKKTANYGPGVWLREGAPVQVSGGGGGGGRSGGASPEVDVEKWWGQQPAETRYQILRAFSAEAVMDSKIEKVQCERCGGVGTTSTTSLTGGGTVKDLCPYCRGFGYNVFVHYQ